MNEKQGRGLPSNPRSMFMIGVMRAHVISTVVIFPLLVTLCVAPLASGKQTDTVGAKIEGTIFVTGSEGKQSFVPGATVKLTGPVTCETQTDENGRYASRNC
jgi:hypothetical protein